MIRVGTAGWSYADWEGRVYPASKPRNFHALTFLARFVDCVEINSSFYALPDPRHVESWVRLVEPWPDFRFTAKLHGELTHGLEGLSLTSVERYLCAIEPLRSSGRLGGLLAQFPLSFRDTTSARARLTRLAAGLHGTQVVAELRHASWFEPEPLAFVGALDGGAWSLAEIDLPSPPPGSRVRHPPAETPRVGAQGYLRVHGRNQAAWFDPRSGRDQKYDYLYTAEEVGELVERSRRLAGGRDETYVITNNHFGGQALANAIEIRAALRQERVPAPAELVHSFPHLAEVVRSEGQQQLF